MMESPFAFFRGAALVMADDLSRTASTGVIVQACGDAHLANFGGFATPERQLVFDVNDFDETHPAPWEWDVKRLAASIAIAGRELGHPEASCRDAVRSAIRSYREHMLRPEELPALDVWYSRLDANAILAAVNKRTQVRVMKKVGSARSRNSVGLMPKLTVEKKGGLQIVEKPPLIVHVQSGQIQATRDALGRVLEQYRATLPPERSALFHRFRFVDFALKVVGVGSVGTRCFVALFLNGDGEPLFLQAKEAMASVLERYTGPSSWRHHGERVVRGQRPMQAAGDIFLGWTTGLEGRALYIRQLRDMKVTADIASFTPSLLEEYGQLCGWALARAHARTGDAAVLAGYLGHKPAFDEAVVSFAERHADQNERDHAAFLKAIRSGRLQARPGV